MMRKPTKPIRVFWSPLSERFYASKAWKQESNGVVVITGQKFDVTEDVEYFLAKAGYVKGETP